MSRTYRKPEEHYCWHNADAYAKWKQDSRYLVVRWNINGTSREISLQNVINEAKESYNSWGRDGGIGNRSRKEYNNMCTRNLRAKTKQYISRAKWDDEMPPR